MSLISIFQNSLITTAFMRNLFLFCYCSKQQKSVGNDVMNKFQYQESCMLTLTPTKQNDQFKKWQKLFVCNVFLIEICVGKMGVLQMKKELKKTSTDTERVGIQDMLVVKPNHLVMSTYFEKEAMCMGINSHLSIVALRPQV